VASAKLNSINPETYLKEILTRIAEGHPINRIDELMPADDLNDHAATALTGGLSLRLVCLLL
jgi:hypothetical protein